MYSLCDHCKEQGENIADTLQYISENGLNPKIKFKIFTPSSKNEYFMDILDYLTNYDIQIWCLKTYNVELSIKSIGHCLSQSKSYYNANWFFHEIQPRIRNIVYPNLERGKNQKFLNYEQNKDKIEYPANIVNDFLDYFLPGHTQTL